MMQGNEWGGEGGVGGGVYEGEKATVINCFKWFY